MNKLKNLLENSRLVKIAEILFIFLVVLAFISLFLPLAGDNLVQKQIVIWFANILMLLLVWAGLRIRGQGLDYFGITFKRINKKDVYKTFLLSLLVFVCAVTAFVLGSIIMANITGIPENSDMSAYGYMQENFFLFLLTLLGSYIVASFGEEVIYRAFLINRLMELGLTSRTGKLIAIIISAIIFGLVHYQWGPMGIVQTTFMGLVLAYFYLKFNKRIWILVLAHAYMDTILMLQLYFAGS